MNGVHAHSASPRPALPFPLAAAFFLVCSSIACSSPPASAPGNMAAAREAKKERKELRDGIKKVASFFKPMGKPAKYDWLATHNEPGQTFEEYLDAEPRKPTAERQTLYVMPVGQFNGKQQKAIDAAAVYLEVFFDLHVQRLPPRALNPTGPNVRLDKLTRTRQVRSGHVLDDVLKPALPSDAAALIAF